jgi:maltose phosphorylase
MAESKASPRVDIHPWHIIERGWRPESVRGAESLFAIGNGRFGQRANFEETYTGDHLRGSYLAGVYYPDKTRVGWWKNGYPEYFAKVLNATNWLDVRWSVDGEEVDLAQAEVLEFERILDMKTGVLQRRAVVKLRSGVTAVLEAERWCSMANPDTAAIRVRLRLDREGPTVRVAAGVDGNVRNEDSNWDDAFWRQDGAETPRLGQGVVANTTHKTHFGTATAMDVELQVTGHSVVPSMELAPARVDAVWEVRPGAGETVEVVKFIGIATTLHHPETALRAAALHTAEGARSEGYVAGLAAHVAAWVKDRRWRGCVFKPPHY